MNKKGEEVCNFLVENEEWQKNKRVQIYFLVNEERNHIEALKPNKEKEYINAKTFYEKSSDICKELLKINSEIEAENNECFQEIENDDNINRSVIVNSRIKHKIPSRQSIKFITPKWSFSNKSKKLSDKPEIYKILDSKFLTAPLHKIKEFSQIKKHFRGRKTYIDEMKEKIRYNTITEAMRNIRLRIDLCCSCFNGFGEIIFRVFNSFNELRDHFGTQHNGVISKYSFLMRVNQIIIEQT